MQGQVGIALGSMLFSISYSCSPGGGRFVKKTFRKYNFPLINDNLRHYFYFLPVRVSNILKF